MSTSATRGAADARAAVVVSSMVALVVAVAACRPWSTSARDGAHEPARSDAAPGDSAGPLLAGSADRANGDRRPRRIGWDTGIDDASSSEGPLAEAGDTSPRWNPSLPMWMQECQDDVVSVIDRQTRDLAEFSDDDAILRADTDDEADPTAQVQAVAEHRARRARRELGEPVPEDGPTIPLSREPFDLEAFLRNCEWSEAAAAPTVEEIAAFLQRAPGGELTVERVLATLAHRREARAKARRQAVREFRFERARLRPDSVRDAAARRGSRKACETEADVLAYWSACADWDARKRQWLGASLEGEEDERALEALVRSIPSRSVVPPPDETRPVDPERQRRWQELIEARGRPDDPVRRGK